MNHGRFTASRGLHPKGLHGGVPSGERSVIKITLLDGQILSISDQTKLGTHQVAGRWLIRGLHLNLRTAVVLPNRTVAGTPETPVTSD